MTVNPNYFIIYLIVYRVLVFASGIFSIYLGYKLFSQNSEGHNSDITASFSKLKLELKRFAPGSIFSFFGASLICFMIYSGSPELTWQMIENKANNDNQSESFMDTTKNVLNPNFSMSKIDTIRNYSVSLAETERKITELNNKFISIEKDYSNKSSTLNMRGNEETEINRLIDKQINELNLIQTLTNQALKYVKENKPDLAQKSLEKGMETLSNPMNALAWIYLSEGKIDDALDIINIAKILTPNSALVLNTYTEILLKKGDVQNAFEMIKKAYQIDNSYEAKFYKIKKML